MKNLPFPPDAMSLAEAVMAGDLSPEEADHIMEVFCDEMNPEHEKKTSTYRAVVTDEEVYAAFSATLKEMNFRLSQKGNRAFSSRHEILGVLVEEMHELTEEVHSGVNQRVYEELLDLAVGAIFGAACIKTGKTEW